MFAFSQLELGGSAKVKGRLSYSLLKLEPGAVFEGELEHQQTKSALKSIREFNYLNWRSILAHPACQF